MTRIAGILGITPFLVFCISLIVFGFLNKEFSFLEDYIIQLGARGEPFATWWNIFGFLLVGVAYGKVLNDQLTGVLLALFGVGFCFYIHSRRFGRSRFGSFRCSQSTYTSNTPCPSLPVIWPGKDGIQLLFKKNSPVQSEYSSYFIDKVNHRIYHWTLVHAMTHRLVFGVVFGWTALTSCILLLNKSPKELRE